MNTPHATTTREGSAATENPNLLSRESSISASGKGPDSFTSNAQNRQDRRALTAPRRERRATPRFPFRAVGRNRVALIVDSPNAFRSTKECFGADAHPDWKSLMSFGRSQGQKLEAIVAVNDGYPAHLIQRFRLLGYSVQLSHSWDVDDRVVAQAVRMARRAEVFVIVSGDGGFCSLVTILRRLHKRVIVVAVERCCHPNLRALADKFHPLPVISVLSGAPRKIESRAF